MNAAALGLAVALAASASAGASEQLQFGPFSVYADEPELIYLDGDIGFGAADDFTRARQAAAHATTLILSSDGGHVVEASAIARAVRDLGLNTYVPLRRGCYSACAYIFLAGVNRRATGQLGVHQVSDPAFTALTLQRDLADLIDLLFDFGVDRRVVTAMLRTPPQALYVLDTKETALLGVDHDETENLDWLDDKFGSATNKWTAEVTDGCQTISWGAQYEGCVPVTWIPTAPEGDERYYQDADHRMGMLIIDPPGEWTRDGLRLAVLGTAAAASEQGVLQELEWPVRGAKFDLMIYSGLRNGSDVLYQHFYRALPQGGAVEVLVYSAAGEAWRASSMAAQVLSQLRADSGL